MCSTAGVSGAWTFLTTRRQYIRYGYIVNRRTDGWMDTIRWSPSGDGLPPWTDGIVATGCIATYGSAAGLADKKGNLYVSTDVGRSWSRRASGLPPPSSVLIV